MSGNVKRRLALIALGIIGLLVWAAGVAVLIAGDVFLGSLLVIAGVVTVAVVVGIWRHDSKGAATGVIEVIAEFFGSGAI